MIISRISRYLHELRDRQRISIALAKGAATMRARRIDLTRPGSWEFSGFSQNGEDGIIDVLRSQLAAENRYFIEIGSADGIENNSAWLVVAEQLSGLMIEGNPTLAARASRLVIPFSIGAECRNMFVTRASVPELKSLALRTDPDVFSLDIDGNDYHIASEVLAHGFRPKIFVVEYNSAFGPERAVTVRYRDDFVFTQAHPSHLYYGVSIGGWRKLFAEHGYRFVTVNRHGVNAFFVDTAVFDGQFLQGVQGLPFAENLYQYRKFRSPHADQFRLIADQEFVEI